MTTPVFGKYAVDEKIGEGGFGEVFKGRHPVLKSRLVAIKTCASTDEELQQRFLREAEIAATLQHPNIVAVFDFDYQGETPYLVQEHLTGEDLDHKISRRDPLSLETKLECLLQIAAGLQHAHSQGIIHRDIKPSNIRVLENGQVKIMDFGIAKLMTAEHQLTRTGMTLGTAAYLAPEQIRSQRIDPRADLFSFGVLAYELLAYSRPFHGDSLSAILYAIAHQSPRPLSECWPECPPRLARLIDRCLQKDPEQRHSSAAEVMAELEALGARRVSITPIEPDPTPLSNAPPLTKPRAIPARRPRSRPETAQPLPLDAKTVAPTATTRIKKLPPDSSRRRSTGRVVKILLTVAAGTVLALSAAAIILWLKTRDPTPEQGVAGTPSPPAQAKSTAPETVLPSWDSTRPILEPDPQDLFESTSEPAVEGSPADPTVSGAEAQPITTEAVPDLAATRTADPDPPRQASAPPPESTSAVATTAKGEVKVEPGAPDLPVVLTPEAIIARLPYGYERGILSVGQPVYADQNYRYGEIPAQYRDLATLKTFNADKTKVISIRFAVSRAVEVFVAHDQRIKRKPVWLGTFRPTGHRLTVDEGKSERVTYEIYVREFDAGEVVLGANMRPRSGKQGVSMYAVFIRTE